MKTVPKKMMIVDERAMFRLIVRRVAAMPADSVMECRSVDEALSAVGTFRPDCVLLGVTPPTAEVYAAIRNIRQEHPKVRVVAVGHFHENRVQRMAIEAGASSYVATENLAQLFLLAAPERLSFVTKTSRAKNTDINAEQPPIRPSQP
jgi:DNA-binding NarL/FixJ family response regulator